MGVVQFLCHPDPVRTASDLGIWAIGLLSEIPIPGVDGCIFDSGISWEALLNATVDQKSINERFR